VRRRRPGHGDGDRTTELSDDLPDLVPLERIAREVAAEWDVELGEPFTRARYSYVAPAGDNAVLKVTPPEDDESDEEADALAFWAGAGAVRLLRCNPARRALLVERARPGEDIAALHEEEATEMAVGTGLRLWRPAAEPFRWIGDHVPRWLDNAEGHELVSLARELYASVEVGRKTLVHGDFHHHNILRSELGPVAIDPKPMLGEPEYDVPSFLSNPIPYRMERDTTERRLAAFAAAGLDEERMRVWGVIRGAYLGADENESAVLRALL
jgi:streptomycin 6-kinase